MKIASLVPSITETLFDFGLDNCQIIARTKFCVHPQPEVGLVPIIGGTKNVNIKKILSLNPDLIIANKEENEKGQIEILAENHKVWLTDIANIEDNREFLKELGYHLNKRKLAQNFIAEIDAAFPETEKTINTAYLIWQKPYMTVGKDTFVHDVMFKNGLKNIFGHSERYPQIFEDELHAAELILLSTEPFPFNEKHVRELQYKFPDKKIMLADGEAFSWYGTHLSRRKSYFQILQQEIFG